VLEAFKSSLTVQNPKNASSLGRFRLPDLCDEMQLVGKVRCKEWLNAESHYDSSNLQSHVSGVSKVTFRGLRASRFVCFCQALRPIIIINVAIKTV
jgi:hypothetical protein